MSGHVLERLHHSSSQPKIGFEVRMKACSRGRYLYFCRCILLCVVHNNNSHPILRMAAAYSPRNIDMVADPHQIKHTAEARHEFVVHARLYMAVEMA